MTLELVYKETLPEDFILEPSYFHRLNKYSSPEVNVIIRASKTVRHVLSMMIQKKIYTKPIIDPNLAEKLNIETQKLLYDEYEIGYVNIKIYPLDEKK